MHLACFAERAGLSGEQITSLTHGGPSDMCWADERDRLLIEAADALHDSADLGEDLWLRLIRLFSEEQLLDLMMLAGWYHAISFTANGARVACEDGSPRFAGIAMPHVTVNAAANLDDATAIDVFWSSPGNGNSYNIYVGYQNGTMKLWSVNRGAGSSVFHGHPGEGYWFWASVTTGLGWTDASGSPMVKLPAVNHAELG